jgi:hypothetical protein
MPKIKVTASAHTHPLPAELVEMPDMEEFAPSGVITGFTISLQYENDRGQIQTPFPSGVLMSYNFSFPDVHIGVNSGGLVSQSIITDPADSSKGIYNFFGNMNTPLILSGFYFSQQGVGDIPVDPADTAITL